MEKAIDDFKNCRICRKPLSDEEKKAHQDAGLPATCEKDLVELKKQLEICAPIFATMNLS